mmetsp:Transcript_1476/g.980  ORF Transcript_1476/g.980 Transcript_1476/m.980 type:complete len:224 (+) Transcript_1476:45-716(+)
MLQKTQPLAQAQQSSKLIVQNANQIFLPSEYPDYSKRDYWNSRYTNEQGQVNDWYLNHEQIKGILHSRLFEDKQTEIMILGSGNSELGSKLYEDGYNYITNVDFSEVVTDQMKERYKHLDEMDYVCLDITEQIDISEDSFDCIIDKACLDSVACSGGHDGAKKVDSMIANVFKVLAPGGSYVSISRGPPETRLVYFNESKYKWQVESLMVQKKTSIEMIERID